MQPEPAEDETVPMTIRLRPALKERLRRAAFDQREPQNTIIVRALERELADDGS